MQMDWVHIHAGFTLLKDLLHFYAVVTFLESFRFIEANLRAPRVIRRLVAICAPSHRGTESVCDFAKRGRW